MSDALNARPHRNIYHDKAANVWRVAFRGINVYSSHKSLDAAIVERDKIRAERAPELDAKVAAYNDRRRRGADPPTPRPRRKPKPSTLAPILDVLRSEGATLEVASYGATLVVPVEGGMQAREVAPEDARRAIGSGQLVEVGAGVWRMA